MLNSPPRTQLESANALRQLEAEIFLKFSVFSKFFEIFQIF